MTTQDEVRAAADRLREYARIAHQGTPIQRPAYHDSALASVYLGTGFTLAGDRAIIDAAFPPLTPEEAERAYNEAGPVPMTEAEIQRIVAYATGKHDE